MISFPYLRFVEEGGLKVVLTLLLAGSGNILRNPRSILEADVMLKQLCLEVLSALCLLNTAAAEFLGETDEVLIFCFHLLNHTALYAKACLLIEHILMAKRCTLNLCVIPRLPQLLTHLEGGRLATFCKILAITVSDLDIFEHKSSLYQQNIQKRSDDFVPVRDINQELVLSVPGFLRKLVDHAARLPYNPRSALLQCFGSGSFDPFRIGLFSPKSGSRSAKNPDPIQKNPVQVNFISYLALNSQHYPFWSGSYKSNERKSFRSH